MDPNIVHAVVSRAGVVLIGLAFSIAFSPLVFRPRRSLAFFNDRNSLVKDQLRDIIPRFKVRKKERKLEDWSLVEVAISVIIGLGGMMLGILCILGGLFSPVR
jgi:hypothetical protein